MSLVPPHTLLKLKNLRELIEPYVPSILSEGKQFRLEVSTKAKNPSSRLYEYTRTGERVVTCCVRCANPVCNEAIQVPLESQSQWRLEFQKYISGQLKKKTAIWLIATTNEPTCFDNAYLESALLIHQACCKQKPQGRLDHSNADGGDNAVEECHLSEVSESHPNNLSEIVDDILIYDDAAMDVYVASSDGPAGPAEDRLVGQEAASNVEEYHFSEVSKSNSNNLSEIANSTFIADDVMEVEFASVDGRFVGQEDVCANKGVVVTSEVLAYNDNDYDNDNDNDNDNN